MKVIIALSGGMDSAVLLAHLLRAESEVQAVHFNYGSRHGFQEEQHAVKIAEYYGINLLMFNLGKVFQEFKSALLSNCGQEALPLGHYTDASMKKTVVPGRNTIFASILLGLAQSTGYDAVALANHAGDALVYPDCRLDWVDAMHKVFRLASEESVILLSPFVIMTKANIVSYGTKLNVNFELTRSCYSGGPYSCGKCGTCVARLEAFKLNGLTDPVKYVKEEYGKDKLEGTGTMPSV